MSLNESASFLVSLTLMVLTFSGMQILKPLLASTQMMTIAGGFLGSLMFVFLLTSLANLGKIILGKGYVTQWIEVGTALVFTVLASSTVHRVCGTTALLFSLLMLYFMNKLSQETYGIPGPPTANLAHQEKSKKRK